MTCVADIVDYHPIVTPAFFLSALNVFFRNPLPLPHAQGGKGGNPDESKQILV